MNANIELAANRKTTNSKLGINNAKKINDRDKLEEVAGQFEALFVKSILSSARSAQLADPLLNSEATKTFNSMLDQEYATALSKRETLGIADALVVQFQHRVSDGDV